MPPAQMAICMAFELATYGFISGLLHRLLPDKAVWMYVSLAGAMVVGRLVYCAVAVRVMGIEQAFFAYFGTQFINTWLGIVIHMAIVPPIVYAIEKYRKNNP